MPGPYLGYLIESSDGFEVVNGDGVLIVGPNDNLELIKKMAFENGVTLVPAELSGTVKALRNKPR